MKFLVIALLVAPISLKAYDEYAVAVSIELNQVPEELELLTSIYAQSLGGESSSLLTYKTLSLFSSTVQDPNIHFRQVSNYLNYEQNPLEQLYEAKIYVPEGVSCEIQYDCGNQICSRDYEISFENFDEDGVIRRNTVGRNVPAGGDRRESVRTSEHIGDLRSTNAIQAGSAIAQVITISGNAFDHLNNYGNTARYLVNCENCEIFEQEVYEEFLNPGLCRKFEVKINSCTGEEVSRVPTTVITSCPPAPPIPTSGGN
jgi:hypothetical protein